MRRARVRDGIFSRLQEVPWSPLAVRPRKNGAPGGRHCHDPGGPFFLSGRGGADQGHVRTSRDPADHIGGFRSPSRARMRAAWGLRFTRACDWADCGKSTDLLPASKRTLALRFEGCGPFSCPKVSEPRRANVEAHVPPTARARRGHHGGVGVMGQRHAAPASCAQRDAMKLDFHGSRSGSSRCCLA